MLIIAHRVNTIEKLKLIPPQYGVEIDVRHDNRTGKLYLHHDPQTASGGLGACADLDEYLSNFRNAFVIFNTKEAGTEQRCIEMAAKHGIPKSNYFLLDVEFPYLYRASRKEGVREIAVRYSEAEPIEMTSAQHGFVDWVWIDTNTHLPIDEKVAPELMRFKTCLVSPDRWRPQLAVEEIRQYRAKMRELDFRLDAVMVGIEHAQLWEE